MKQIGSELSGRIYDIAYETRYMSEETKKSLLREMKNLDTNNFVVKNRSANAGKTSRRGMDSLIGAPDCAKENRQCAAGGLCHTLTTT